MVRDAVVLVLMSFVFGIVCWPAVNTVD